MGIKDVWGDVGMKDVGGGMWGDEGCHCGWGHGRVKDVGVGMWG